MCIPQAPLVRLYKFLPNPFPSSFSHEPFWEWLNIWLWRKDQAVGVSIWHHCNIPLGMLGIRTLGRFPTACSLTQLLELLGGACSLVYGLGQIDELVFYINPFPNLSIPVPQSFWEGKNTSKTKWKCTFRSKILLCNSPTSCIHNDHVLQFNIQIYSLCMLLAYNTAASAQLMAVAISICGSTSASWVHGCVIALGCSACACLVILAYASHRCHVLAMLRQTVKNFWLFHTSHSKVRSPICFS